MTRAQVLVGDCLHVMSQMEACSVDSIVTDPPYELGFMGKSWDASGVAFRVEVWREALRVLKPGGHLLAFSGSRTYHRMAVAIEDAGFEIRDQIMWVYGSGFPKSLDVSKAIDAAAGAEREVIGTQQIPGDQLQRMSGKVGSEENKWTGIKYGGAITHAAKRWHGWGTALKPAHEPIVVARKPIIGTVAANVLAHGTGALNIDGCRVMAEDAQEGRTRHGGGVKENHTSFFLQDRSAPMPEGRWPANLIHDGSEEVVGMFPDAGGGSGSPIIAGDFGKSGIYGRAKGAITHSYADAGSAARFFYCAKASKRDRDEGLEAMQSGKLRRVNSGGLEHDPRWAPIVRKNIHPTVKPTDLMRYLCRLVTPPGGLVLDPFTGSGSTGKGAVIEGFRFLGVELSPEYAAIARARIQHAVGYVEPQPVAQDVQDDVPTGQLRLFA